MISFQHVTKTFGPVKAVVDISFEINHGEVIGFLGPNGAGKTTVMRLMTGFFPPTDGKVLIDGNDLFHANPSLRKKIGYLPENNPIYRDMVTRDYLSYVATLKGIPWSQRKLQIEAVVDQCQLESVLNRMIGKLSKGFQQRIGLAQALLGMPEILILDEPTNGLDPKQIIEMRNLIKDLGCRRTVILSTHTLSEVRKTCQRILILNHGRLIASGTEEELAKKVKHTQEIRIVLRGKMPDVKPLLERISGVSTVDHVGSVNDEKEYRIFCHDETDVRSEIARQVMAAGFELLSLQANQNNLEDIFLQFIEEKEKDSAHV